MTHLQPESQGEALPLTVLLPDTAAEPIIMFDSHAALRLALVERDAASPKRAPLEVVHALLLRRRPILRHRTRGG